ncbi:hypothetical protein IQ215_08895 [Cyanobacterium stanieri LEGE 03274]|uniref:Molecular chaperone GrpE n=1 Tax=Cyanobacterium stanieri LEGE 03274 TaxID=1828756 RepID=A0ABR9V4L2_9CHRO|nr:hypothetical protein [Cyanobacterium stanieri]MBE9222812.1 hypothetical protein [Cyanobacterium stanieri LEGE 03274]
MKDFFLGLFLWLGSSTFLMVFLSSQNPSQNKSISTPRRKKLLQISEQQKIIIDNLQGQLNTKTKELQQAQTDIIELQSDLNVSSEELESSQDKYQALHKEFTRKVADLTNKILELEQQNSFLTQKCEVLPKEVRQNLQAKYFQQLESLLTNYPTAKIMVRFKPDLPAKSVVCLLKPLEELLAGWEITPVGQPWRRVNFNPNLHQPDADDIREGDWVYVRFVGYAQQDEVLVKAKVSRFLPGQEGNKTP